MLKVLSDVLQPTIRKSPFWRCWTLVQLLIVWIISYCTGHSPFWPWDKVVDWLRSFLTGRTQQVLRDGSLSEIVLILFGVPRGSVIGPILFFLYVVEVFGIILPRLSFLCG